VRAASRKTEAAMLWQALHEKLAEQIFYAATKRILAKKMLKVAQEF